jgi:AcrR family transcriptional regulator
MSTEKLDTEIRQVQIAEAALGLVASQGMKGLSVAGVARRVGLVPSGIYRHFKGKDGVLDAALNLIGDRLLGNVADVCKVTPDPVERLRLLLIRHIQLIRENQAIPRVVFSDEVYGGHSGRKVTMYNIVKSYLDKVAEIVRQGQQEGRIRGDVLSETITVMLLGIVQSAAILWHLSDETFDVTKHAERAWKILSEVLRT